MCYGVIKEGNNVICKKNCGGGLYCKKAKQGGEDIGLSGSLMSRM